MKGLVLKNSKCSKTKAPHQFRAKGFTLIELLVTIAMSSIVLAAIGSVYMGLTRSYTRQNVMADVQQTMRAGIDFMVEDIMMAGMDPNETGLFKFEDASAVAMRFTSDRNKDGDIDNSAYENITYRYEAGTLLQCLDLANVGDCVALPANVLLENVTDLSFAYLDENGDPLVGDPDPVSDPLPADDLDDIRTVVISMTVREPAGRGDPVERTYTTRVRCRNLGLN